MTPLSPPSSEPLRHWHAAKDLNIPVHPKLPEGWREITQGFQQNEAWMLLNIISDLRGTSFGQRGKADSVEFALVDSHNGFSIIRPRHQLKLGSEL